MVEWFLGVIGETTRKTSLHRGSLIGTGDSLLLTGGKVLGEAFTAKTAGRTMTTTVARNAIVTGEGAVSDEVQDTQFVRHLPGLLLVNPHEWGVDDKLVVHGQVEGDVETLDEGVTTVGITAEIGLAHACDKVVDAELTRLDSSNAEEEEVAARDKGGGIGLVIGLLLLDGEGGVREGTACTQTADEGNVHAFPFDTRLASEAAGYLDLKLVLLAVKET